MDTIAALILGIIQGLTEFLPVSSSGHLVLAQKLLPGFEQPGILFDVFLHLGTLFAVFYYFRTKIFSLSGNYIKFLIIGTIPAVFAGLLFREEFEAMFADPKLLGFEFLLTALINFMIDKPRSGKDNLNIKNSFLIGTAQAFAILPAVSRSGATIFAGVMSGIDKKKAAEFSFLLSIPAILGANVLEVFTHRESVFSEFNANYFLGFLAAFIVGFFSISVVIRFLKENKFRVFGYYCLIIGILVILFFK